MARLFATAVSASIATLALATAALAAPVSGTWQLAQVSPLAPVALPLVSNAAPSQRWTLCKPGLSYCDVEETPYQRGAMSSAESSAPGSATEPRIEVVCMPPAPSSLAMFTSALLALGAYHGARSLPRLHLGHIPDWYHSGAGQIGHVMPFDLGCGAAMSMCAFDEPASRPTFAYRIPREPCSRVRSHFLLLIEAPRDPPPAP